MTDTTNTTDDTDAGVAGALDLRPPAGGILHQMLRLGLQFDHSDDGTAQTWCDYGKQLRCDFTSTDADTVTFTDMTTRLGRDIPAKDLPQITEIITWRSGQTTEGAV
ncbi:hypothetical protein DSM100688_0381 [Bifidobacterium ramosum]|uniref:Uncharacterized protein n=1 Tax=Bifidobacterium ramosum TaxID=1798158 RepID=A0A6L4X2S0_9BIFI|nr:hypothetical protein [Bifidobacterium ramosum]KAB8289301.1 hypothetical protein DSM100688_0381 [Bifidobacterium ramosum]NEG71006.1 hypothetical protein [Bifidobacterium ramosum]